MEKLDKVMRCLELCYRDECESCDYCGNGCSEVLMKDALELLKKQDILRAELAEERERSARWLRESEPVVHAHWIPVECGTMCSGCKRVFDKDFEIRRNVCRELKRCPDCGAHMDEEVAE